MVDEDSGDNNVSGIERKERPRGVAVIANLQVILGFLAFAYDVYSVNTTHFVPGGGAGIMQLFIPVGLVIAGIFSLVLGYGILMGWHWTWLTVIVLDVLGIMYSFSGLIEMISLAGVLSLIDNAVGLSYVIPVVVVCSVELWYFSRKRTKDYFAR